MRPDVKLGSGQIAGIYELDKISGSVADEHSNFFDMRGDVAHDFAYRFCCHIAWALLVKDEPERIGARFDRGERVFEVGYPANLYPRHAVGYSSSVLAGIRMRFIFLLARKTLAALRPGALAMLLQETSRSLTIRRSKMPDSRLHANGLYPRRCGFHSRPLAVLASESNPQDASRFQGPP